MRNRANRFDVQLVFDDATVGIKNRPGKDLTPLEVVTALEEFCARMRLVEEFSGTDAKQAAS